VKRFWEGKRGGKRGGGGGKGGIKAEREGGCFFLFFHDDSFHPLASARRREKMKGRERGEEGRRHNPLYCHVAKSLRAG